MADAKPLKKEPVFALLGESIKFTWRNKILWIFGWIKSLFSRNTGLSVYPFLLIIGFFFLSYEYRRVEPQPDYYYYESEATQYPSDTDYFWSNGPTLVLTLTILSVIACVAGMSSWYLNRVSTVSIIRSVSIAPRSGEKQDLSFKDLWKGSHKFLPRLLLFDLIVFGLYVPLFLITILMFIFLGYLEEESVGNSADFFGALIFLPWAVFSAFYVGIINSMSRTGHVLMAVENAGVSEACSRAWKLFMNNIWRYVGGWLRMIIPTLCERIVYAFASWGVIMGLVGSMMMFSWLVEMGSVGTAVLLLVLVVVLLVFLVNAIFAPYVVFVETFWAKFVKRLIE